MDSCSLFLLLSTFFGGYDLYIIVIMSPSEPERAAEARRAVVASFICYTKIWRPGLQSWDVCLIPFLFLSFLFLLRRWSGLFVSPWLLRKFLFWMELRLTNSNFSPPACKFRQSAATGIKELRANVYQSKTAGSGRLGLFHSPIFFFRARRCVVV